MDPEKKLLITNTVDRVIQDLFKVQTQSYFLRNNLDKKLLQNWQELSSLLKSISAPEIIIDLISKNESFLTECQDQEQIASSSFHTLYASIMQLSEFLSKGRVTENFERINTCSQCRENPIKNMPKECRDDFKRLEATPHITLTANSSERFKAKAKTLLIANTKETCTISEQLAIHQHEYDKISCIQDLYPLGKELWKYEIIILDTDHSTTPFFLSLRVLNTVHKKASIVACGENKDTSYAHDFSDIAYYWLGKKSSHFSSQLGRILNQFKRFFEGQNIESIQN